MSLGMHVHGMWSEVAQGHLSLRNKGLSMDTKSNCTSEHKDEARKTCDISLNEMLSFQWQEGDNEHLCSNLIFPFPF